MKYLVGNWKMFSSKNFIDKFVDEYFSLCHFREIDNHAKHAVICPPTPYIDYLHNKLENLIQVGGQNVSIFPDEGAFTSNYCAKMLADCGATYCILGHWETRSLLKESNENITTKIANCLSANLTPILCVNDGVGEADWRAEISSQLETIPEKGNLIIAYEPVKSIGGNSAQDINTILEVHKFIKKKTDNKYPVLYGGAVNRENISEIASHEEIDGVLVGRASLNAAHFYDIKKIIDQYE